MRPLIVIISAFLLQACAAHPDAAAPRTSAALTDTACDEAFVVASDAWTTEGFGGVSDQLIVHQRQPIKRCSPAVVQSRTATLDANR